MKTEDIKSFYNKISERWSVPTFIRDDPKGFLDIAYEELKDYEIEVDDLLKLCIRKCNNCVKFPYPGVLISILEKYKRGESDIWLELPREYIDMCCGNPKGKNGEYYKPLTFKEDEGSWYIKKIDNEWLRFGSWMSEKPKEYIFSPDSLIWYYEKVNRQLSEEEIKRLKEHYINNPKLYEEAIMLCNVHSVENIEF